MKQDQKRALGIGAVGLGGILLWRRMHSGSVRRQQVAPVTTTGSVAPYTPQDPVVLQPGESIFDPNSQALLTTPDPISTVNGDAGAGNQTSTPAAPHYTVNVNYPKPVAHHGPVKKPHPGRSTPPRKRRKKIGKM